MSPTDADGRIIGLRRVSFGDASSPYNKPLRYVQSSWFDHWWEVCCPRCGVPTDDLFEPHSKRRGKTYIQCPGPPVSALCESSWFGQDVSPHLKCAEECYCPCHTSACCCHMIDNAPLGIVVCPKHGLLTRPKEN